jgi:hypothetical protein
MSKESRRHNIHLFFLEHSEKCLDYFVHQSNHRLSMGKSLLSFLVVIGLEMGVTSNDSSSHQVEVFTQTGVPSLRYSSSFKDVTRLIDTGVGATEGNEVLVALKSVDGSNFSKEVSCSNFTNTRDTGDDLHLFILSLSHQRYQGLRQLTEALLEEQQIVCTVSDQRSVGSDANRLISQLPQLFNTDFTKFTDIELG